MGDSYLFRRNNVYYFRIKIPLDVSPYFNRKEIWKSLNTTNLKLAKSSVKPIAYRLEELFTWIRSGMLTDDQIQKVIKDHLTRTLKGFEAVRTMGVLAYAPKGGKLPANESERQQSSIAVLQQSIEHYSGQLFNNDFSEVEKYVDRLLDHASLELDKGSKQYTKMCREFLKAEITIRKIEIERLNGNYDNTFDGFLESMVSSTPVIVEPEKDKEPEVTLSKVIEDHIKEAMQANSWTEKSLAENESIYKVFLEIIGDRDIKTITYQDLIACRDKLVKLPSNRGKNPKLRTKSIEEILTMKKLIPMSLSTVNKYLVRISTLFKWAAKHRYISVNYAEGLTLQTKKRASEDREAYSAEDIQVILEKVENVPGKPERYWVPMIGLYSGMRLEEICQLHVADIIEQDSIACFDINDNNGKKLKTQSSRRVIPIHPKLIELGLKEYVDTLRDSGKARLWENLTKGRDGYSHDLGKWYQRFNRKYVTENPKRVFHSFRHTLANTLKQKGVQEVVIAEIMGHAVDSMTMSRYGKVYEPKVLLEALSKLEFEKKPTPELVVTLIDPDLTPFIEPVLG